MGVFFDYFIAPDDQTAATVIDWPGGPAARLPTLDDTGVEPTVTLGMFQEMLTGKTFDEQLADPSSRPILADRDGGERLVLRVGDDLVTPLSEASTERLGELAGPWSQIEEFWGQGNPQYLSGFLLSLQEFALRARSEGQGVYCWVCV